jgi:CTP:molybdopterin cytidylyltransferase MocA/SAM-dependent methyltransferase
VTEERLERSRSPRTTAIVLAAGAGRRFGGAKLEARVAGRTILQHVLDALAAAGIENPIVVLPPGSGLEATVAWRAARRVVNPEPDRGISSSLQLGWGAALATDPRPDAVLVALGDQPRLTAEAIRAVVATPLDPARPIVAARFPESGARNPVRIEPGAMMDELVRRTEGDRGLGPLLDARPDLMRWLDLPGDNPDVDRRADLVAAIEADWADRVRRNREQVERFRETGDDADHYAPVAGMFRDDPRRSGDAVLDALLGLTLAADTWLDVGAGAGRYAFPIALRVREVIALDPSAAMVAALRDGMAADGIANVCVIEGRWPAAAASLGPQPCADAALIANVGHDTESIGPFVDALDAAARRLCVAIMQEQPPAAVAAPFFEAVHGETRTPLPALPDFADLLEARGTPPAIELFDRPARRWRSRDELLTVLRRQTWVVPGSAGDRRLQRLLDERTIAADGGISLDGDDVPARVGLVRWVPRPRDTPDQAGGSAGLPNR